MADWLAQAEPADLPEPQVPMERAAMAALGAQEDLVASAVTDPQAWRV